MRPGISASREVVYRTVTVLAIAAGAIVSCEHVARWEFARVFNDKPEHEVTVSMEHRILRHIDEIAERCREEGVPLLLAANPWRYHVTRSTDL